MWGRRILYLIGLLGCVVFYGFYREWFSWILLLTVLGLPVLSVTLSLPAMCTAKVYLRCPEKVQLHTPLRTALQVQSFFPAPRVKSRVRFHNLLSGDRYVGLPGERVPTDKCGRMDLSWDKIYIYDYLGLFRRKVREGYGCQVDIFPKPIKAQLPATQSDGLVHAWRPKPGGGFAENREVRLYRPGDNLRHIHWKLTAKTGKLMYAEPIEPVQQGYLLTVCLCGNLEEKLGRLLYFSQNLLSQGITHKIHCRTGDGIVEFLVENPKELNAGFSRILQAKPAETEVDISAVGALWHHHIRGVEMGGAGDEA